MRDTLLDVQRQVAIVQNKFVKDVEFAVGDLVLLSTANLSSVHFSRAEKKLQNPFIGPFRVLEKRSEYTYKLELKGKLKRLHPVFHALMLKKFQEDSSGEFAGRLTLDTMADPSAALGEDIVEPAPLSPIEVEDGVGGKLYFLEKVLERKKESEKKNARWIYKVRWRGFGPEEDSWISKGMTADAAARNMLSDFDRNAQ